VEDEFFSFNSSVLFYLISFFIVYRSIANLFTGLVRLTPWWGVPYWVDEVKLLLFIKTPNGREGAAQGRPPCSGEETDGEGGGKNGKSRPRDEAGMMAEMEAEASGGEVEEAAADSGGEVGSELRLIWSCGSTRWLRIAFLDIAT
jgi:hypothetical protein